MRIQKFDLDRLMTIIGEFGWYQKLVFFLLGLPTVAFAFQILGWVFIGAELPHRCLLPFEDDPSHVSFVLPEDVREKYIPRDPKTGDWSECRYRGENNTEISCSKYVYDHSKMQSSVLQSWDLVCDRSWMSAATMTLFMVGLLVGSFVFGKVSDRFGRKMSLFLGIAIEAVFGLGSALTPSLPMFMVFRFMCGFAGPGLFLTNYCLGFELVGKSKRLTISALSMLFFTIGYLINTLLAYLITDWRTLMLVVSLFNVSLLPLWWIIPESPRWLLSVGNVAEAEILFRRISKFNKRPLPGDWLNIVTCKVVEEIPGKGMRIVQSDDEEERPTLWSLFRYPELRCRTVNVCFNWFVCSGVYYGLSLNTSNLGGNPYINSFISAAVEIPAILVLFFLLDRVGRKKPTFVSLLLGGLSLLLTIAVPKDMTWAVTTLSMIGKLNITVAYDTIYLYTAEMYPTSVRNVAVGLGSLFGRIGDVASPFINYLAKVWEPFPLLLFGLMSCSAGGLVFLFPETLSTSLPETIHETKNLGKPKRCYETC